MPTPRRLTEQLSFKVTTAQMADLRAAADIDERSVSDEARRLLRSALAGTDRQTEAEA